MGSGKSLSIQTKPGQREHTCEGCGETFWRYPNKNRGKYCSYECSHAACHVREVKPRTDPQECSRCKKMLPLADYPTDRKGLPALRCRECMQPTPERKRRSHLRKFGITLEEWVALYEEQGGCCPICEKQLPELAQLHVVKPRSTSWNSRDWNTDHCHTTGKVRGILCRQCNMGLGSFNENANALAKAIEYIKKHSG